MRPPPPCSRSTPRTVRTFEPMPSMSAPSETRKWQRSWTCGSHAAFTIVVSPRARTAAVTAFSVPVTEASSRKMCAPTSPSVRMWKRRFARTSAPRRTKAWMCVSSRRRPMTSPPGGGTIASPHRARSGPARRMDARMRAQSSSSSSRFATSTAWTRTAPLPSGRTSTPRSAASASIVSTSRIAGTFVSVTGSSVRSAAATIGSAAFLLPAARIAPSSGRPPSMTKDSSNLSATRVSGTELGQGRRTRATVEAILLGPMEVTRERAWETLTRYTKSEALLRHALAVEASVGYYAREQGEDEELWRAVALLHDFDYEMHPTLDQHPQDGAPILRDEGWPEDVVEAVLSHAEHLERPRDTPLKRTLFACDELAGFVHACGLVRPDGIETLEARSVRKKLKQPSFAAGVHRDEVYRGAEELGLDLDEHIANVVEAMRPIAGQLGLRTGADAS